jgi:hypothetical protein
MTTFAKSKAMALKLSAVPHALFCTFSHSDGKKLPMRRGGVSGVPSSTSADDLFTAEDIFSMESIRHGQYFGLCMNKPLYVENKGYLVCLDVDMKRRPEGDPQAPEIKNLGRWVNKVGALEELSVSGKGNHVFIFAKTTNKILRKYPLAQGQEIEIFGLESSDKKSILLTGQSMEGELVEVDDLEALLIELGIAKDGTMPAPDTETLALLPAHARTNSDAFKSPSQATGWQYVQGLQVTWNKAVEALKFINPDCAYDVWIRIGQALHDAFGDQGSKLWGKWSSGGSKYKDQADIDAHWRSFQKGGGVSIASLFHYAREGGYQLPPGAFRQFNGADFAGLTIDTDKFEMLPPALALVSVRDVISNPSPAPAFVWDGYLPRGVVSILGAHGGTGKSTVALMLCVAAALGRPLFGRDTVQCKTFFVSLEDSEAVVRHRLANICRIWDVNPTKLDGQLTIVDGTEHPELFSAEHRSAGETTRTYAEMSNLVKTGGVGLVVVDNASDAYGGDEIQRRQVRAFIRTLMQIAKPADCALLLLAHVDKTTSRSKKSEGGEGYSGSTAWHNSVRSRLFMTRDESGRLTLEHQKSNLGRCHDALTLEWQDGELPQLVERRGSSGSFDQLLDGFTVKADEDRAKALLRMIAEFESRGQFCSPAITSRNHVFAVLKSEPEFLKLRLRQDDTKRLVTQCQRGKWIEPLEYRDANRKTHQRWVLTDSGRLFAGLSAPTAPTAPT